MGPGPNGGPGRRKTQSECVCISRALWNVLPLPREAHESDVQVRGELSVRQSKAVFVRENPAGWRVSPRLLGNDLAENLRIKKMSR